MAGYITGTEFVRFYDARRVGELLSDSTAGTPVAENDVNTNAVFVQLSRAASGQVDSSCQVGRRYTKADLQGMVDDATSNPNDDEIVRRAMVLKQIVADLTFGALLARRGFSGDTLNRLAPNYENAQLTLQQLYQGARVFDLDAQIDAGVPRIVSIGSKRITSGFYNGLFGFWPNSPNNSQGFFGGNW